MPFPLCDETGLMSLALAPSVREVTKKSGSQSGSVWLQNNAKTQREGGGVIFSSISSIPVVRLINFTRSLFSFVLFLLGFLFA